MTQQASESPECEAANTRFTVARWSTAMSLMNTPRFWKTLLTRREQKRASRPGQRRRPSLEHLEERTLPSALFGTPIASPAGSTIAAGIVTTAVKLDGTSDAVMDFNGDGKADVVTWQSNGNHVFSVLLGKGGGTFALAPGSPVALDFNPIDAVVGDFDGDGKLDMALLGITSGDLELEVWLGDGTGGFKRAASSPIDLGSISSAEFAMAGGDFNKDGNLDLAIANARNVPISVKILTGDGSGGFSPATPVVVDGADSITVADFNKDGNLDLAATGDGVVDVLLGDGAGKLVKTSVSPYSVAIVPGGVPASAHRLQLGDCNNDGKADLVVGGENLSSNTAAVQVLLGDGNGGFTVQPSIPVPQVAHGIDDVIVGDFNGDGKQDLVAVSPGTPNAEVLLGDGTGAFTDGGSVRSAVAVGTGDFNGDGLPDLALVAGDANVYMVPNVSTPPQADTTTRLVSTQNPSVLGQPVTFTATVTAPEGTPTGNVTITVDNGAPQTAPLVNGQVTFTPPTLSLGSHSVFVEYAAQGNFAASAGGVIQAVRRAANVTWSGAGQDNLWSDGANWVGNVAPAPGDRLVFPADAAQQTNVNDNPAGSYFASLLFTAGRSALAGGQYDISGNGITLGPGGITDRADHSSNTIAVPITLAGPAGYITLQNSADTLQLAGWVSDGPAAPTAGLVKSGAGDLVISSGSTLYTGTTLVTRGELDVENNFALGVGAAVVRAGATLRLVLPYANAYPLGLGNPLVLAGTLATGSVGSRPVYWTGSITLSGTAPAFAPGASSDATSTLVVSGTITGGTGLTMLGAGTLVLAGINVYTGNTLVRAGTVDVTNPAGLGIGASGGVLSGAMLALSGGISVAANVALANDARLGSLDGDNNWSGTVTLFAQKGQAAMIEVDAGQLTIAGIVKSGSGVFGGVFTGMLRKTGTGTLVLPTANPFSGGVDVQDGVIDLQNLGGLGSGSILVDDGGTLALDLIARQRGQAFGFKQSLTLSGTGFDNQGALELLNGNVTWSGAVQLSDAAMLDTTTSNFLNVSGTISGDTLMLAGTGDVQLSGSNTYTGATFVLGGNLDLLSKGALASTGEGVTVAAGAALRLFAINSLISQPLTLLDQSHLVAIGTSDWENTVSYAGTVQVAVAAQAQLEIGGFVTGTSGARLEESGGGALILVASRNGATSFATVLGPDWLTPNQIQVDAGFLYLTYSAPHTSGTTLQVSLAAEYTPAIGQAYTIIHDTSANPIGGVFVGLREGSTLAVGEFTFQITYKGGAGSDVVVTRVA
jgi:autotransporter-associated beta strand protein